MLGQTAFGGTSASEIAASVESAVRDGRIRPGEQLPTIRALAGHLELSPMTVASAYRELRRRGILTTAGRRGTRVAARPPLPVRTRVYVPAGARDLATGNPDPELLPPLTEVLGRIDASPRRMLDEGKLPALVELAAAQLRADGIPAAGIAVVSGALDGIERVLDAHLGFGDKVAVEDPGFVRAFDLLRPLGLELEPVGLDERGPRPVDLERALARGARAAIITPRAQNPTGAALDEHRAAELREVLAAYPSVLVIEDDHAAGVAGTPALTLADARRSSWAIVRSVSKSLGPDLRLAVLAGDETTVGRVEGRQLLGTGWVSRILQQLVAALWSDPKTLERLAGAEAAYTERREALLAALERRGVEAYSRSGLNVYVPVAEETAVAASLLDRGWAVTALDRWRLESPPGIRVTIATLHPDEADRLADDIVFSLTARTSTYSA